MKFFKKCFILPCLLFTSLCAMEVPVEDPIRDGMKLISEGIEGLQAPRNILASPIIVRMMQHQNPEQNPLAQPHETNARKIMNGIEILLPFIEKTIEDSRFNPEKGATACRLLQEMHHIAQHIMFPRASHPILGGADSPLFLHRRLSFLRRKLFSYLDTGFSPDKGNPLNLVREGLQVTSEVIQTEDMDGLLPQEHDEFGVQNLLSALSHTGFALWRRHEKKRVEHTPLEQLTEPQEKSEGPFGLDYSIETVEQGTDWLTHQIEDREIVEAVHNFFTPTNEDGSINVERQRRNLALVKQSLDFTIEPDRDPVTLSIVQKIPAFALKRLPESTLPAEALESLKRPGNGFKPSDIARLSQKIWTEAAAYLGGETREEQQVWTREKQQLLKEKVAALLTSRNAERVSRLTESGREWLAKGCSFVHRIADHVRRAQEKEDEALSSLRKLHQVDEEID